MPIELRTDHYLDSPADVIAFETSTKFINKSDMVNGPVKQWYPGVYQNAQKNYLFNLKQSSILVQQSVGYNVGNRDTVVLAGVCIFSNTMNVITQKAITAAATSLLTWFWTQDKYMSLGMSFVGLKANPRNASSIIRDQNNLWYSLPSKLNKSEKERTLYIHCVEGLYLSPIHVPKWSGPFEKVTIWNALFPQYEK